MSDSIPRAVKPSESILERAPLHSSPIFLTETQAHVDQLVTRSLDEATNWKTLAAITAAGAASRWIRLGSLNSASPLLSGGSTAMNSVVRGASSGVALSGESAVFAGMNRTLQPESTTHRSFAQDWMKSAVDLGCLKAFGVLGRDQNFILRQLGADLGLVAGEHAAAALGLVPKPQGNFARQMVDAQALNLSLAAGTVLLNRLAPRLSAAEKSADLLLMSPPASLKAVPLTLSTPKLAAEGVPGAFGAGPEKPLILQMSGKEGSGSPPPSLPAPSARLTDADFNRVRQEFGEDLLSALFGREKESAVGHLATLFTNRPELRQKYAPALFAQADLVKRRELFRRLVNDSLPTVKDAEDLNKTQVATSFFNQALSLFIAFKDHHQSAFLSLQRQALLSSMPPSPPPVDPAGPIPGTRPLPSEFMQPNLFVGGEKLNILPHYRGHYELGRAHFFGDPAVSTKHLFLNSHMGLWYLADARSTYGTYYYDRSKKSWEAYRAEQWTPLRSMDILNIGNAYYRMTVMGGMVHFEPTQLAREIEPNRIRRFTSVTVDFQPFRVELNSTPRGETGGIQIGNIYFNFERGRVFVFNLGQPGELAINNGAVPSGINHGSQQLDPSRRREIRNGDRLVYQGQPFELKLGEHSEVQLFKISAWATYNPLPPSSVDPRSLYDWDSTAEPRVDGDILKMNRARTVTIGRTAQKGTLDPSKKVPLGYDYSIQDKPFLRSPVWIEIKKDAMGQTLNLTNLGVKGGVFIQDDKGKNIGVRKGQSYGVKPGDKLVFNDLQLIVIP